MAGDDGNEKAAGSLNAGGSTLMPPAAGDALEGRDLVVCLGPGGVGKTSATAALAIVAAREGRKVLAFTIDPARRLANAVGMTGAKAGDVIPVADGFDMLMLDVHGTWERVVERHAQSREQFERIRSNRFYDYLTDNFPGFNEYVAIEKLHEIITEGTWDIVIVDTPPTSYALSFLEAPNRILNLLDHDYVRVFLHPYLKLGRFTLGYALQKEFFILRQLARFTGFDMLRELATFIFEFEGMFKGFRDRAEAVRNRLKAPATAFYVVTSPDRRRLLEAGESQKRLREAGYPFAGFIVNRYCWMCSPDHVFPCALADRTLDRAAFAADAAAAGLDAGLAARLAENHAGHIAVQRRISSEVGALLREAGEGMRNFTTPSFPEDIHDLEGLRLLADSFRRLT